MSGKSGMRNSGSGIAVRGGAAARSAAGRTQRVKFGDVVREVKDKIDRADNPYEFYVAGDHMDTEDLKIRRRGRFATDDVGPAFTRVFKSGQILYGSRRTYLKKVCVADFEGITTNTTFVLEGKDENVLLQRLLPFLMLGDRFTDWSIKHSKGSTNPYVLFGDLADYEFDLPPMDEQKKLAELLWAANDLKESYKKAITATNEMLKAKFREMFGDAGDGEDFNAETQSRREGDCRSVSRRGAEARRDDELREIRYLSIGEIGKVYTGSTPSMKVAEYYENKNVPFYKPSDFKYGLTILSTPEFYVDNRAESKCRMFNAGAVLVTCIATVGKVGLATCRGTCNQQINFIDPNENVDSRYLAFAMTFVGDKMAESAKASVVPIVNKSEFCGYKVPVPPLALQREFVAIADKAESAKANLKKSIAAIDQVMKGPING